MYNKYSKTMTGTSGAAFTVATVINGTAIGYRDIGGGQFRVRVDPAVEGIKLSGWTAPGGGQNRFSKVVTGVEALSAAVVEAAKAVKSTS